MAPQFPAIQSFFRSSSPSKTSSSSATEPGDGFTTEEVDAVLHPLSVQWIPTQDYQEVNIRALEPGPKCVTFMGRIVNLYNMPKSSKSKLAARGLLKLTIADDTGVLSIRLWYANTEYKVRIGQLVTIWTVHIHHGEQASLAPTSAPLFTSIFPERERSCHIMLHENSDNGTMFKRPFGWKDTEALPGLMTVKNFTDGGYDVDNCKMLVCVKSVGARKNSGSPQIQHQDSKISSGNYNDFFKNRNGTTSELISIGVFDDTSEASLTLFGTACSSAFTWQPSHTVLLISSPGWRIDRSTNLSLNANTRVDVDPNLSDALWLRALAQRLTRKEHVNPPFPDGVFDIEAAETAEVRILYNLADIDEFARANPKKRFMGYISVLITEVNITINFKRNMLMSTECCGIPIFANSVTARCKQCEKQVSLRINPRILGPVLDETGQVSSGKLLFSDVAWEQLLGRTSEQLVSTTLEVLKALEHRLSFLRVSLGFGWCLEGTMPHQPEEEGEYVLPGTRDRKRKRLDVFKNKEVGAEKKLSVVQNEGKGKALLGDGVGEVGRLCVWCVKM